ncbi:MAG: prepilin-type N-terminal cleavage/methylation domain-containing protein [Gemmatimonadetes bacterium]|nr:prepilin-type N-terminal cleavage/methylation domain-containing protein [Gemmatimonadota bacterium]NIO31348.1 prepilin-type N-terminal cleavage/methylation domain-containing protein [Gemmatimonadota bacterium]
MRPGRRLSDTRGVTMLELIVVALLIGVAAAMALPRALHRSPRHELTSAAKQLTRDLEQARTRALSAKRLVRVRFDASENFYTAFMDTTRARSGEIFEQAVEVHEAKIVTHGSLGGLPGVELPGQVVFGAGAASAGPLGEGTSDPVLLVNDYVQFNSRGMVTPLGTDGVIFLTHEGDPSLVAAVTISGAGAFQAWHYRNGGWER